MRGDSIRDFYAKVLALVGLGVLAGTGALVDYWPAGIGLPSTAGPSGPLVLAESSVSGSLKLAPPVPVTPTHLVSVSAFLPSGVSLPVVPWRAPAAAFSEAIVPSVPTFGQAVSLADPPVPAAAQSVVVVALNMNMNMNIAPTWERTSGRESLRLPLPTLPVDESDSDDGFLTGAVKKTGVSIMRTGAKTGSSIFSAVRTLGGAVMKVLPAM